MKIFLFCILFLSLGCLLEVGGVGVKQEALAPSTALDPNFGHSNSELWRARGRRMENSKQQPVQSMPKTPNSGGKDKNGDGEEKEKDIDKEKKAEAARAATKKQQEADMPRFDKGENEIFTSTDCYELFRKCCYEQMAAILKYLDSLTYTSIPDYDYVYHNITAIAVVNKIQPSDPPDWDPDAKRYKGPVYREKQPYIVKELE
ncbi:hypothetical protein L3Y34_002402 [Caenorhabditis briggsae]|uniref:Uncharacterized protein n=1 Tax=Caenorhabditis briggsae TaxID=6238 RepID=A0AAE9DEU1_CAEBR|nr:hypothetical protein L3Y34_002402 [Caenorhabditis briggsae]